MRSVTLMIRQLQPGPQGLPLELYFFSADRSWIPYEMLQAEVLEVCLAVLPRSASTSSSRRRDWTWSGRASISSGHAWVSR